MAEKSKKKKPGWELLIELLETWLSLAGSMGTTETGMLCAVISCMELTDGERLNVLKRLKSIIEHADQPDSKKLEFFQKTIKGLESKGAMTFAGLAKGDCFIFLPIIPPERESTASANCLFRKITDLEYRNCASGEVSGSQADQKKKVCRVITGNH